MIKFILGSTFLMLCLPGVFAAEKSAPADPDVRRGAATPAAVSDMLKGISEIGAVLQERQIVYAPDALKSNVLEAVVKAIDPQGGAVLTPAEAARRQDEERGLFYGIGCKLRLKNKWPQIVELASNSPALAAGLAATNLIIKVGEKSTEGLRLTEVGRLLQGGHGEELELTIRSDENSAETRAVKLVRSLIREPVTGTSETWPQGIGYLKVNGLYTNSGAVIMEQLKAWQETNCFGVILDLRGANGMDLESVAEVGSLFASAGETLFVLRNGGNNAIAAYQARTGAQLAKPVMVLIDHATSGAGEVLAGLLSVCKSAMLIGMPTRGDDRLREIVPLADGRVLYIATRRIELSKGPAYYQKGIAPHVRVEPADEATTPKTEVAEEEPDIFAGLSEQERQDRALIKRIGNDVVLRRASDILLGLKALDFKVR